MTYVTGALERILAGGVIRMTRALTLRPEAHAR